MTSEADRIADEKLPLDRGVASPLTRRYRRLKESNQPGRTYAEVHAQAERDRQVSAEIERKQLLHGRKIKNY